MVPSEKYLWQYVIIFVYQSSLLNGSLLICILVKKVFIESIYIYFPKAFTGGDFVGCRGGYWWENPVNSKLLNEKAFTPLYK